MSDSVARTPLPAAPLRVLGSTTQGPTACLTDGLTWRLLATAGAAALPDGRAARYAAAEQLPSQEPEAGEHGRRAAGTGRAQV